MKYCIILCLSVNLMATELGEGYWSEDKVNKAIARTLHLKMDPDLGHLSEAEKAVIPMILQAGELIHELYILSKHDEALKVKAQLEELDKKLGSPKRTQDLLALFYQARGPITSTIDNQLETFLPTHPWFPGKSLYPKTITKEKMDKYLAKHPEQRAELLNDLTLVRDLNRENLSADLEKLDQFPLIDGLHPGLRERLTHLKASPKGKAYYAIPYSLANAKRIMDIYALLNRASEIMHEEDPDFARYLKLRARDLVSDDYEAGDAAWVTGKFRNLNLQIGAYETYDDHLYGVKRFYGLSLLVRDIPRSNELMKAIKGLQGIEDNLPYDQQKQVRSDIPVGVYQVIADFGQARGSNTATILPNDPNHTRKYGRTILLRANILTNEEIYKVSQERFQAATNKKHWQDLNIDANLNRTLWHEIGHYLGVSKDKQGRDLGMALAQYSDHMEELKSDLVSLHSVPLLIKQGFYDKEMAKAVYASGILRTLQTAKPRMSQAYNTMQLMQMNYFMEKGALSYDSNSLTIHYEHYPQAVEAMLKDVLAIQYQGDVAATEAFIKKYTTWDEKLHQPLAEKIRNAVSSTRRLVRYGILE